MILRAADVPDANGRQPLPGEMKWTFTVPLEGGGTASIELGRQGCADLLAMLRQEMRDDEALLPPGESSPVEQPRERVERALGRTIPDHVWTDSEPLPLLVHEGRITPAEAADILRPWFDARDLYLAVD